MEVFEDKLVRMPMDDEDEKKNLEGLVMTSKMMESRTIERDDTAPGGCDPTFFQLFFSCKFYSPRGLYPKSRLNTILYASTEACASLKPKLPDASQKARDPSSNLKQVVFSIQLLVDSSPETYRMDKSMLQTYLSHFARILHWPFVR